MYIPVYCGLFLFERPCSTERGLLREWVGGGCETEFSKLVESAGLTAKAELAFRTP